MGASGTVLRHVLEIRDFDHLGHTVESYMIWTLFQGRFFNYTQMPNPISTSLEAVYSSYAGEK